MKSVMISIQPKWVDIFQDQSVMKNKIIDVSKLKYGRVEE